MCDIEAIGALIDGELPESEAACLRAHIDGCPSCRALLSDLNAIKDGFAALDVDPPDTLAPGIVYKYGLGDEPPRKRRIIRALFGVAACVVAVIVISQAAGNTPAPDGFKFLSNKNSAAEHVEESYGMGNSAFDQMTGSGETAERGDAPGGGAQWHYDLNDGGMAAEAPAMPAPDAADWWAPAPDEDRANSIAGSLDYDAFLRLLSDHGFFYVELDAPLGEGRPQSGMRYVKIGEAPFDAYEYAANDATVVLYVEEGNIRFFEETFGIRYAG